MLPSLLKLRRDVNGAILRHGGDGERTVLICGAVRFEGPAAHPLVDLMPTALHIRAAGEHERPLRSMLEALGMETRCQLRI